MAGYCCEDTLFEAANWLWSFFDEKGALDERKRYNAAKIKFNAAKRKYLDFCVAKSDSPSDSYLLRFPISERKDPVFSDFFQPCDEQKRWETGLSCVRTAGIFGGAAGFAAFQLYMFSKIRSKGNE